MTCFECEACHKRLNVATTIKDRVYEIAAKLPDCAAAPGQPPDRAAPRPPPYHWDSAGAGTQLKKLLSRVGIKASETCSCNARAKLMNEHGIEWCEQNINEIVGWLKEEALKRKLPFLSFPTKILIQRAIGLAKRNRDRLAARAGESSAAA
jgi:hypothetical protein